MTPTPQIELEIKIALAAAEDHARVDRALGPACAEQRQCNIFFDTADLALRSARLGLRVRQQGNATLLTLKGPKTEVGGAARRLEIEVEMDAEATAVFAATPGDLLSLDLAPIHRALQTVSRQAVVEVVRFDNLRRLYPVALDGHALELALDRTAFADGTVDFEVEVELPAELAADRVTRVCEALEALLDELGVEHRPQPHGKLARALAHPA